MKEPVMRIAVIALVLLFACTTARAEGESKPARFAESDRAVLGVLKSQIPEVDDLARVHRIEATPELDIVVAFSRYHTGDGTPNGYIAFGAFLQRRDRSSLVYKLSARSFRDDPTIIVERATPTDLVLSVSEDQGGALPTEKLVFDPRAKSLVRHFHYARWNIDRAFLHGSRAVFLALGHDRVAFDFDPARERPFQILSTETALQWSNETASQPVTFGKNGKFRLAAKEPGASATLAVEETGGGETKRYPIPQSTQYSEAPEYRNEEIGAWDLEDDTLWVGKTFYAGEGETGIGGFGWFDEEARTFRLSSPPEVRGYSITAMRVEKDAIWMSLTSHGEWGDSSNGLARYDRSSRTIRTLPLREPGKQFLRVGDSLVLVTESFVVLVSNDSLRTFFVDETSDGRLRVAEAVGSER